MTSNVTSLNTIYGAAVILEKDDQIYLSRRSENVTFPKKWQFINGRINGVEQSLDCAMRIVEDQTGLKIADESRFYLLTTLELNNINEFYYVYAIHLEKNENPFNTCDRFRGDWRAFPLEKAVVLDVVTGIRDTIKHLHRGLIKAKAFHHKNKTDEEFFKKQFAANGVTQLSQGELLHLEKLGAKYTRYAGLGQYPPPAIVYES